MSGFDIFPTYTTHGLSQYLQLGESMVLKYALWMGNRGLTPPIYAVYFGDIAMMFMSWCAAACQTRRSGR